jgi:hypothetical protein
MRFPWRSRRVVPSRENDYLTPEMILTDAVLLVRKIRGQCHRRPHQR